MNDIALTLSIIGLALVLFAWNRIPAIVVAIGASLALYFTGVLTMPEALTGFGDPVVILIAALLAIAVAVEVTGVGAWAGQWLLRRSGGNEKMLVATLMIIAAIFSGLIGMNGAVAAMVPVTVIIAVRTGKAPSLLMIPLALACLKGAKLTLLGSPVNVIAATQAETSGAGHFNFFAWALLGIPQLLGAILIVIWWGDKLLPVQRTVGLSLSPFNAWVVLKGMETLGVRMKAHSAAALAMAQLLELREQLAYRFDGPRAGAPTDAARDVQILPGCQLRENASVLRHKAQAQARHAVRRPAGDRLPAPAD